MLGDRAMTGVEISKFNTQSDAAPPNTATNRIAQEMSFIHCSLKETMGTLHELHNRLLGPTPPQPVNGKGETTAASNRGLVDEITASLSVLKEQATRIESMASSILRAI